MRLHDDDFLTGVTTTDDNSCNDNFEEIKLLVKCSLANCGDKGLAAFGIGEFGFVSSVRFPTISSAQVLVRNFPFLTRRYDFAPDLIH